MPLSMCNQNFIKFWLILPSCKAKKIKKMKKLTWQCNFWGGANPKCIFQPILISKQLDEFLLNFYGCIPQTFEIRLSKALVSMFNHKEGVFVFAYCLFQVILWNILKVLFVSWLVNVCVFNTCVQHSNGLGVLQGIEFPLSLVRFLSTTFPCLTVWPPLISWRFLLPLNAICIFKYSVEFSVYLQDIRASIHNYRYVRKCSVVCYW